MTAMRDLLTESGSIFVQIGDENVHRVRALMDEVFGEDNLITEIIVTKTTSATAEYLAGTCDYIIWYAKNRDGLKFRQPYLPKEAGKTGTASYNRVQSIDGATIQTIKSGEDFQRNFGDGGWHLVASDNLTSQSGGETTRVEFEFQAKNYRPASGGWKTNFQGLERLEKSSRLAHGGKALRYVRRLLDFPVFPVSNLWSDTSTGSHRKQSLCGAVIGKGNPNAAFSWLQTPAIWFLILLRLWHNRHCGRTMGAALDHHRYVACFAGSCHVLV